MNEDLKEYYNNKIAELGIITKKDFMYALNSIVWYNGLTDEIKKWKDKDYLVDNTFPQTFNDVKIIIQKDYYAQLQVFWMLCVLLFGDYGTSPRTGWIEQRERFEKFIDELTYMEE